MFTSRSISNLFAACWQNDLRPGRPQDTSNLQILHVYGLQRSGADGWSWGICCSTWWYCCVDLFKVYPFHVFLNHWNLQFLDVFSFFERQRGIGIQRLGRGGISCHGNPRCTCFSLLKTGQLVIMTTMMKQVKLGLRVLETVNQEALDIVQRVCHKGHIMDHLSLHRWYVHDCSQLGLGVQLASWAFTLMKLGNL